MKTGIDISSNNGPIDWVKVKSNTTKFDVDFVYFKSSEGIGYTDRTTFNNAQSALRQGIKIGYYHFASLNEHDVVHDATDEANYFLKNLKTFPKSDLPPVLDIETNKQNLSHTETLQWINTFMDVLVAAGYKPVIYTYGPFVSEFLPPSHGIKYDLWLAQYTKAESPKLPPGFDKAWLWQFSNKGNIDGITGQVDLNKFI